MASDRCDADIFKHGESIAALGARSAAAEAWVQRVAAESGQRVDWHYSGGCAHVLFIGDREKVRQAIERLTPDLDGTVLRVFCHGDGLYRAGDSVPPGTLAVDTSGLL